MKKKSAIIGALVIGMLFTFAIGAVGVSAMTNTNGVAINNAPASLASALTTTQGGAQSSSSGQSAQVISRHHHQDNDFNEFGVNQ